MTTFVRDVIIRFEHPPIPDRNYDWQAYREGMEEGCVGYGATEVEALAELLMLEADEAEAAAALPLWTLDEMERELIDR